MRGVCSTPAASLQGKPDCSPRLLPQRPGRTGQLYPPDTRTVSTAKVNTVGSQNFQETVPHLPGRYQG